MQRPSQTITQEGVRKRAAGADRALRVRCCAARAVKSLVETLEARVFLSVAPASPGYAKPIAIVLPIASGGPNSGGTSAPPSLARTPAQLRGAYGLGQYGASNVTFGGIQGDGSGQTIAIIDVYDDPNAASDLHNFDVAMGLPDAPSFVKVNEFGSQTSLPGTDPNGPNSSSGTWEEEESLDIEYSHAMAPKANIILVECESPNYSDLIDQGVNWARYQPGVSVISMSFGGGEWSGETSEDPFFTTPAGHQGVTFVASTGDSGAYDQGTTTKDVEYPAISPNVLAVGGTTLTMNGVAGPFSKIAGSGTTATITAANNFVVGNSVTVAGLSGNGAVFDGTFTITSANSTSFKFASGSHVTSQSPTGAGTAVLANTTPSNTWGLETGWGNGTSSGFSNGGGGGVSTVETQPVYQAGVVPSSLSGTPAFRTIPDISAEADPNAPGVALYDSWDFGVSTPWLAGYEGGTSLSAPLVAGMIAVANQGRAHANLPTFDGPNELLPAIYKLHASSTDYHDVTAGNNGFAASAGYDLVTGIGTPIGNNLLPDLIANDTAPVISSFTASPNPATTQSTDVVLSVTATNSPTEVDYYFESNGIAGLQTGPGGDTETGSSNVSADGFAYHIGGYGTLPKGTFTFYAVAKNSFGVGQAAVAHSLYTAGAGTAPTIGSLSATPSQVVVGSSLALTANTVIDNNQGPDYFGTVSFVNFWRESNGIPGLQVGTGGDTLVGSTTASDGSSNYSGIVTAPTTSGTYTFYAQSSDLTTSSDGTLNVGMSSADGVSAVSTSVTVVSAAATQLAFSVPPANGFSGVTLPSLTVQIEDQFGNLVTSASSAVTLTLNGGSFAAGSTVALNASGGIATFANLAINSTGSFTITASDGTLTAATSPSFTVGPVVASQLVFGTPPASGFAGVTLPTLTVELEDQSENLATSDASAVTLILNGGAFAAGSTVTVNASGGIATFSNLAINSTGSFTITASDGALTQVTSPSFTISPAAKLSALVATGGASTTVPGTAFTFTITIANGGQTDVTGAAVADAIPAGVSKYSFIAIDNGQGATGYTASGSGNGTGGISDTVNLPAGAIITYSLTCNVSPTATGALTDTATVSTPSGTLNPNANVNGSTQANQNSASLSLMPMADSYVAISGGDPLTVGSVDVYTIEVTNKGPSEITGTPGATGLTVADTFSSLTNVTYVSQVLYGTAAGNTQGASPVSNLALGDVLTMGVGAIVRYTITGTIAGGAPSTLTDTVSLAAPAGTTDPVSANNVSSVSAAVSATATATVTGRSIFYRDNFFDGNNTGAPTAADFNAIAPDKTPLMPGQSATFNNYSGYSGGIDGLFVDISGDPNPANVTASDFEFIVGNNSTPGTGSAPGTGWSALATAPTITPFPGQGTNNSDRFALTWPNGTISGKWVQITVLADANTALATPDVFYFGSAPGDGGNSTTDARVNATDELNARNDPHTFLNRASISDPNDFNRDSFVNGGDESVARSNSTTFLNALNLISVPGFPNQAGVSAPANAAAPQPTASASPAGVSASAMGPSSVAASSTAAPVSPAKVVSAAVSSRASAPVRPKAVPTVAPARSSPATRVDEDTVDNNNLRTRLKSLIRFISPLR